MTADELEKIQSSWWISKSKKWDALEEYMLIHQAAVVRLAKDMRDIYDTTTDEDTKKKALRSLERLQKL